MKLLNSLAALTLAFCFIGYVAAFPADVEATDHCTPTYTRGKEYTFDWEDIIPPCYYGPCYFYTSTNMTSPRGAGLVYTNYAANITKPWIFPNEAHWQGINCTSPEFADKDEALACGTSNKAMFSPGKSPYDARIKPVLGTKNFVGAYAVAGIDSLWVTPIRLPTDAKTAKFEITGYKADGKKVSYAKIFNPQSEKRFRLTGLLRRGFVEIKALEFWITVKNQGGWPFAIDDLFLTEYLPKPLPAGCGPTTTAPLKGPCTPKPTATTTWTYNAEEFKTAQAVPTPYKSLNWPSYVQAVNESTNEYINPPIVKPSSGKNIYKAYGTLGFLSSTYETRFGVDSIAVACGFFQYADPDYGLTNGRPCIVTFVGRRDRYDGSGLPSKVVANVTIPNPGNVTTQVMKKVNMNKITKEPGAFKNLYSLTVFARVGDYGYETTILFDDLVVHRDLGAKPCRVRGGKVLNFDDIPVPGTSLVPPPQPYQGFKLDPAWAVAKKTNYPKTSPGYIAAVSGQNSLYSGYPLPLETYSSSGIDSYFSPSNNFLYDFEEAVITLNVPDTSSFNWTQVQLGATITDACGSGSVDTYTIDRQPWFYYRAITPEGNKFQVKFAEPIRAISRMYIYAYKNFGDYERVEIFVDNFKYRVYDGPTPGCQQCGRRGGDWCEFPKIIR